MKAKSKKMPNPKGQKKSGSNKKAKTEFTYPSANADRADKPQKEGVWEVRENDPIYETGSTKPKGVWQLQEAKAMFSQVVRAAQKEPQIITVHGKETAVLLSYEEYRKDKKPKMTLFEFFRNSPFYGIELDIPPRVWEPDRDINL